MNKYIVRFAYLNIVFFFLLCASCGKNKVKIPKNIISKDSISLVLTDMQIVDAAASFNHLNGDSTSLKSFYKTILSKYGIDRKKFKESMDFYFKNPEILNEIYQKSLEDLQQKQAMESNNKN